MNGVDAVTGRYVDVRVQVRFLGSAWLTRPLWVGLAAVGEVGDAVP